jgi:hypothetical protein
MTFDPSNFDPGKHSSEGGGELVAPGTYICIATKATRNNERGKPQIDFMVQPVIEASTGKVQSEGTAALFETATLTEKAVWRFANMCEAIQTGPFNANSDREVQKKILGKPFVATIVKDSYGGIERRKISGYKTLNSANEKAYEAWREDAALNQSTGQGGNGGGGSSEEDDIPF